MTGIASIQAEGQKLAGNAPISLYTLDLTPLGVPSQYCFTKEPKDKAGTALLFAGVPYYPVDLETDGWEYATVGPFPQPTMSLSNVFGFLSGLLYDLDDLVGAYLYRTRTFRKFLDDGATPDPTAVYPTDFFKVHQKKEHNRRKITFVLAAAIDQQGVKLPRRIMQRDTCDWIYRTWDATAGEFNYDHSTCPYNGTKYVTYKGVETLNPALDECSLQLADCSLRFGKRATLPFGAFPGIVRYRV